MQNLQISCPRTQNPDPNSIIRIGIFLFLTLGLSALAGCLELAVAELESISSAHIASVKTELEPFHTLCRSAVGEGLRL